MTNSISPIVCLQTVHAPVENPAVQRCIDAWNRRMEAEIAKRTSQYFLERLAAASYRAAMPDLTSPAHVRDFIACTARGVLLGAIDEKHSSKLLYAAQVASGAYRLEDRPQTKQSKSAEDTSPKEGHAA